MVVMVTKHWMIEWLSWLPNKGSFTNSNILEIVKDSPNIPTSFKFLEQKVHELAGGSTDSPPFSLRQHCGEQKI